MMTCHIGNVAAILPDDDGRTQTLLGAMVADWRNSGAKIVGLIGETHGLADRTCGAGYLRDIVSGEPFSIYLESPPNRTSRHLDAAGVANACRAVLDQIPISDLVVFNKFGKLESMGGGLAVAFRMAIRAGKPVLTSVSDRHRDALLSFAPHTRLFPADEAVLQDWWRSIH
jgi:hypothetical protein